jgi:hypothetical protein
MLHANPGPSSSFGHWTGASGCGTSPDCQVMMTAAHSVAATFPLAGSPDAGPDAPLPDAVPDAPPDVPDAPPDAVPVPDTPDMTPDAPNIVPDAPDMVPDAPDTTADATPSVNLTLKVLGDDPAGTCTVMPAGSIGTCQQGAVCTSAYPKGTHLSFMMDGSLNSTEVWTGCSNSGPTCALTINDDTTVTVTITMH